jgi:hypothetical protein
VPSIRIVEFPRLAQVIGLPIRAPASTHFAIASISSSRSDIGAICPGLSEAQAPKSLERHDHPS